MHIPRRIATSFLPIAIDSVISFFFFLSREYLRTDEVSRDILEEIDYEDQGCIAVASRRASLGERRIEIVQAVDRKIGSRALERALLSTE